MTGHMMGAAGAFEAFATVMTVAEQCAPATINYREFDPEADIWVVCRDAAPMPIRHALSNNIGLGGHNGAIIFKRWDGALTPRYQSAADPRRSGPTAPPPGPLQEGMPCPRLIPSRRAVVTGLGAVMPIGNDFETYWANLRNGVTGTRRIRSSTRAGSRSRSRPRSSTSTRRTVMDAKMVRRMSRFIHLAMGAGKEAVAASGIDFAAMRRGQRDRVGVVVNTGGGGIEADHRRAPTSTTEGPALRVPVRRCPRCRARWPAACCRWSTG